MNDYSSAISDFQRARWKGTIELLLARLTGRSADLLSYEDVRKAVQATAQSEKGLQDIPVKSIVGSMGRYNDFTHNFMPRHESDAHRWAGVRLAAERGQGLPPIELYKIGEAYFVKDGNHRVSIARDLDIPTIQAWVTEIQTRVPFTADMNADDLVLARQQAEFLTKTRLDKLRPESNVRVTEPGKYPILLDHIRTHQYFMGIDQDREVSWEEAVTHWYDEIYLNVLELIRQRGILEAFPDRTETDFYVWLADHRQDLESGIGWDLPTDSVVESFASSSAANSVTGRILDLAGVSQPAVSPRPSLDSAINDRSPTQNGQLIQEILVTLGPEIDNQTMLTQAVEIAKHENATVRAIYTSADANGNHEMVPTKVQTLFDQIVIDAEITGRLAADVADWSTSALERARWNDFILAPIYKDTKPKVFDENWRNLLVYSAKPILAVTDAPVAPKKAFLVYTGHRKDQQSLFITAWLASQWGIEITVGIGGEPSQRNELISQVEGYLSRYQIKVDFEVKHTDTPPEILNAIGTRDFDLIIASMRRPLWSRFRPSSHLLMLDLLQDTQIPVLILN